MRRLPDGQKMREARNEVKHNNVSQTIQKRQIQPEPASRLAAALASNLTSQSANLTDAELAVFEEDASLDRMSGDVADALCEELANYVGPDRDPESAKAFLDSFATWVARQRSRKMQMQKE